MFKAKYQNGLLVPVDFPSVELMRSDLPVFDAVVDEVNYKVNVNKKNDIFIVGVLNKPPMCVGKISNAIFNRGLLELWIKEKKI